MAIVDGIIFLLILLSMLIGIFKGFIKESISLATWIAAIIVGLRFSTELSSHLPFSIENEIIRISIAFAILFFLVLIIGGLISYFIGQLVRKTGLSGTDRFLGLVFGALRGGLIVTLLVLLATRMVPGMQAEPWWEKSKVVPWFVSMADELNKFLPAQLQDRLKPQDDASAAKAPEQQS